MKGYAGDIQKQDQGVVSSTTKSDARAPILFFFTQILAMGTVSP
jgi:hypothetical protein